MPASTSSFLRQGKSPFHTHRRRCEPQVPPLPARCADRSQDPEPEDAEEDVRGGRRGSKGDWDWDLEWDFDAAKGVGVGAPGTRIGVGFVSSGIESFGEKISEKIPGYRVSAAFLATLRQNLALTTSLLPPDSPSTTATSMSSPPSMQSSITLPSASSTTPSSHLGDAPPTESEPLPPLTYQLATASSLRYSALHLIADSLAQRRQTASAFILTSAPFLAVATACLGALIQFMYAGISSLPLILTTAAAVAMVLLIGVRMLGGGYLALAEEINWEWLGDAEVVVVEWGDKMVGAVAFSTTEEGKGKKKVRRGLIRAWTVRLRERGRGVGMGLLEELCRIGVERGWEGVDVEEEGIYDRKVLPRIFHGAFERKMKRAREVVGEVWEETGGTVGRKKGK